MSPPTDSATASVVEHGIKDLSEAQLATLLSIQTGDLILVQHARNQQADSDREDDEVYDEDEEEDDDDQHETSGDEEDASDEEEDDDEAADVASISARDAEFDPARDLAPMMYMVQEIYKDGVTGEIKDIRLLELEYDAYPNAEEHSFQILDHQCVVNIADGVDQITMSIGELVAEYEHPLHFTASPDINLVVGACFENKCPMDCNEGWLRSIDLLHGAVKDYTIASSRPDERAICPACISVALMKEHQDLRAELEAFLIITDFDKILDFHGRFQLHRRQMGYAFEQFDERRWGFLFDDMVSEEGSDDDNDGYEEWDEATDPSNNAPLRPASQATIDALPRSPYAQLKKPKTETNEVEICHVCREEFTDAQKVVQLPCGHFFCDGDCVAVWLKQYNSCPACRSLVPNVEAAGATESKDEPALDNN